MQQVHLDWGVAAALEAAERGDVVVIVDVLSFSTTAAIALERKANVVVAKAGAPPAPAAAGGERDGLSPARALALQPGDAAVLASLNGAACVAAVANSGATVMLGALRNRAAVVGYLAGLGLEGRLRRITLVACAEQRSASSGAHAGSMRPCLEDWLGAGAIAAGLEVRGLTLSPDAQAAAVTFAAATPARLGDWLRGCASGRELTERGFGLDVELAARVDATTSVPVLDGESVDGGVVGLRDALDAP